MLKNHVEHGRVAEAHRGRPLAKKAHRRRLIGWGCGGPMI
jgi:hypothetical protein